MRLKDIMSTKVEAVRPEETLEHAQALMRRRHIHHLVVVARHKVVGILTEGVLQIRGAEGVERVEDAMSRHFVTGAPEMTVRDAANLMRGRAEGAIPVIRGQTLAGIVTVSDLLDVLGRRVSLVPKQRAASRQRSVELKPASLHSRRG
jgi:CBS domain-containing protein